MSFGRNRASSVSKHRVADRFDKQAMHVLNGPVGPVETRESLHHDETLAKEVVEFPSGATTHPSGAKRRSGLVIDEELTPTTEQKRVELVDQFGRLHVNGVSLDRI